MAIWNWCSDGDVLEWVSKIVDTAVGKKKSVRLDDLGKIVMMGIPLGLAVHQSLAGQRIFFRKRLSILPPPWNWRNSISKLLPPMLGCGR
jgi:hypothetical protein